MRKPSESDRPLCTSVDISSLLSRTLGGSVKPKVLGAQRTHERHGEQNPVTAIQEQLLRVQETTALEEGSLFSPNICLHI